MHLASKLHTAGIYSPMVLRYSKPNRRTWRRGRPRIRPWSAEMMVFYSKVRYSWFHKSEAVPFSLPFISTPHVQRRRIPSLDCIFSKNLLTTICTNLAQEYAAVPRLGADRHKNPPTMGPAMAATPVYMYMVRGVQNEIGELYLSLFELVFSLQKTHFSRKYPTAAHGCIYLGILK